MTEEEGEVEEEEEEEQTYGWQDGCHTHDISVILFD